MVIKNCEYDRLEEEIDKFYEADDYYDEMEEIPITNEIGVDDAVVAYAPAWRVTDKNIIIMEGVYCNRLSTGQLEPDWSLTLVYDDVPDDQFDPDMWLYFEQDGPAVSIHNYLHSIAAK